MSAYINHTTKHMLLHGLEFDWGQMLFTTRLLIELTKSQLMHTDCKCELLRQICEHAYCTNTLQMTHLLECVVGLSKLFMPMPHVGDFNGTHQWHLLNQATYIRNTFIEWHSVLWIWTCGKWVVEPLTGRSILWRHIMKLYTCGDIC